MGNIYISSYSVSKNEVYPVEICSNQAAKGYFFLDTCNVYLVIDIDLLYSLGDECDDDIDNDGIENEKDNCVRIANSDQLDTDEDTVGDECDNCPKDKNKNQKDINQNLIGDICEQGKFVVTKLLENDFI